MTVKQFFKSTAFKCIIALLCVLLVSGVFLTLMHSLLEVSDEERDNRSFSQIYGKTIQVDEMEVENYNDNAIIERAVKVKQDGNFLIKATGKGGYNGGSVTCWVVIEITNGAVSGVGKVVVNDNVGQTQIGEISSRFLNSFSTGYKKEEGFMFSTGDGFLVSGSTMSSRAVCNAVNGALDYANAKCGNVAVDIYKEYEFEYLEAINTRATSHVVSSDLTVTYTITTNGYGNAGEFVLQITVGEGGVITNYEIVTNGSTSSYDKKMPAGFRDGTWFEGMGAQEILDAFKGNIGYDKDEGNIRDRLEDNDLTTGASQSSYLCIQAAVFATANYDLCVKLYQEQGIGGGEAPEQPTEPEGPDEPTPKPNIYTEENGFYYVGTIDAETTYVVNGDGSVSYKIVNKGYEMPDPFTVEITVDASGVITSYKIVGDYATGDPYTSWVPEEFIKDNEDNWFVGKTIDIILSAFGGNIDYDMDEGNINSGLASNDLTTGASQSSYLLIQAAAFATKNYERCIELWEVENAGGEGNESV